MSSLYITKNGAVLRISGERLIVTLGKKKLTEVPALKIRQILIFGNGLLTPQTTDYVLSHNIEVAYLSTSGQYRGRLQPPFSQNLPLRKAQYQKFRNSGFCLLLAKDLIRAKLDNYVYFLQKKGNSTNSKRNINELRRYVKSVARASSLDNLRGVEGAFSALYFKAYRQILKTDLGFQKRIKHPPPDPINILLSLGYTLLFNMVHSMINLVGLDPYQGFLHQYKFGHAVLASDIMEPFRAPVIDALVARVINLGIIKAKHFKKKGGKVNLIREGIQRYFDEYERKMNSKRFFEPAAKHYDFRQIAEWQCRRLGRVLLGKNRARRPFMWRN